jgi:hypothetical protein
MSYGPPEIEHTRQCRACRCCAVFTAVAPPGVAVAAYTALRDAAAERAMLVEALDRVSGVPGVIVVASNGEILHANQTATALLREPDGLHPEARGLGGLRAQTTSETAKLRHLIGSAAINAATGGGSMRISRP